MEGWKCPVCSRGVAPGLHYCDHGGALMSYDPYPYWNQFAVPTKPWDSHWSPPPPVTSTIRGGAGYTSQSASC